MGDQTHEATAPWMELFELTSDFRWEQDASLRIVSVSVGIDTISGVDRKGLIGGHRWDGGAER
jgi:hypothetical protein